MNEKHITDILNDYIDGTVSESERKRIENHLAVCQDCRKEHDALTSLVSRLHNLPKSITPPAGLLDDVESKLEEAHSSADEMQRRTAGEIGRQTKGRTKIFSFFNAMPAWYSRAAAAVVILAAAGFIWFMIRNTAPEILHKPVITEEMQPISEREEKGEPAKAHEETVQPSGRGKKDAKKEIKEKDSGTRRRKTEMIATAPINTSSARTDSAILSAVQITKAVEKGIISGKVIDVITGKPIAGAHVLVTGTSQGATTDSSGNFTISALQPGKYSIRASIIGYEPVGINVEIDDMQLTPLTLAMNSSAIAMAAEKIQGTEKDNLTTSSTQTAGGSHEKVVGNKAAAIVQRAEKSNEISVQNEGKSVESILKLSDIKNLEYQAYNGLTENFNTEEYDRIYENDFLDVADNPLSTFSIDVDNASYSNVRRYIENGQMPPADAVRTEELINYFTYDYPQPSGRDPFSITMEMSACPWNRNHNLLLVGLQGKNIPLENLPPSNLVFLLDVSGSMNQPNKLPLVKSAFRLLVGQLREEDRVAIVVYAGRAGLVLESTPGSERHEILRAIDELEAGGSTAGGEGILLAYRIAGENFIRSGNNRVILATDGDFNVGVSSDAELVRLIEKERNRGIFLTVLGFGTGNYKDSKMEKLADKGNGNYAYIDNLQEARKVFVGQMTGTLFTIAKDVKIQIEFNPANVNAYRLIGYENRLLDKKDFNDDRKDAGEMGAGHSVTALYELIMSDESGYEPDVDPLKYQRQKPRSDVRHSDEVLTIKIRYKHPDETESRLIVNVLKYNERTRSSANLRWAAAVSEFGMLLRNSEFKGNATWDNLLDLAGNARDVDNEGYRAEFIRLAELCKDLSRSYRR